MGGDWSLLDAISEPLSIAGLFTFVVSITLSTTIRCGGLVVPSKCEFSDTRRADYAKVHAIQQPMQPGGAALG